MPAKKGLLLWKVVIFSGIDFTTRLIWSRPKGIEGFCAAKILGRRVLGVLDLVVDASRGKKLLCMRLAIYKPCDLVLLASALDIDLRNWLGIISRVIIIWICQELRRVAFDLPFDWFHV